MEGGGVALPIFPPGRVLVAQLIFQIKLDDTF